MKEEYTLVRFTNGEEVIGQVEDKESSILIKNGHSLIAPEPGKIGFIPFMAYTKAAKSGVEVDKKHIMFMLEPLDSLVDQIRGANAGIMVPNKEIVT